MKPLCCVSAWRELMLPCLFYLLLIAELMEEYQPMCWFNSTIVAVLGLNVT